MPDDPPDPVPDHSSALNLGGLVRTGKITTAELGRAVDAYIADPDAGSVIVGDGVLVDVGQALAAQTEFGEQYAALADKPAARRAVALTAVLLSHPVKA